MDASYREVIDAEIQDKQLRIKIENDDRPLTYNNQKKVITDMIKIVEKDSDTDAAL